MGDAPKSFKVASIVWSLLIAAGLIVLAGTVLLPSTKRARFDFTEQEGRGREPAAAEVAGSPAPPAAAAPVPTTQP